MIPKGEKSKLAPPQAHSKKPAIPKFPVLAKLPTTPAELFLSLACTARTSVIQVDPLGKNPPLKQKYALPWPRSMTA